MGGSVQVGGSVLVRAVRMAITTGALTATPGLPDKAGASLAMGGGSNSRDCLTIDGHSIT